MNYPDIEKLSEEECFFADCVGCAVKMFDNCEKYLALYNYEILIKSQCEAVESERDQLKAENERLREALNSAVKLLKPFADIAESAGANLSRKDYEEDFKTYDDAANFLEALGKEKTDVGGER